MDFTELCYKDPYMRRFKAEVLALETDAERTWLRLDRSCFYPEGGGQPGDRGQIEYRDEAGVRRRLAVCDTQLRAGEVWHALETAAAPALPRPGAAVEGEIDWALRFARMQMHSAEHLFSGLALRRHSLRNVGFGIGEKDMHFDFDAFLGEAQIAALAAEVNAAITADLPIEIRLYAAGAEPEFPYRAKKSIAEALRLIRVADIDACACCGTHLRRTGEIGLFIVTDSLRYKGGVRVHALAGGPAQRYVAALMDESARAARRLSAQRLTLDGALAALLEQNGQLEQGALRLSRLLFDQLAAALPADCRDSCRVLDGFSDAQMKDYCKRLAQARPGRHFALRRAADGGAVAYFGASTDETLQDYSRGLNAALQGRGGGRGGFVQGALAAELEDCLRYFAEDCMILPALLL